MKKFLLVLLIPGLVLGGISCQRATEEAKEEAQGEEQEYFYGIGEEPETPAEEQE